uniref:Secreted protein n=1 Tax=Steinernema glaseri TaxID=37863 RepID=A0A1I7Y330_9BILA
MIPFIACSLLRLFIFSSTECPDVMKPAERIRPDRAFQRRSPALFPHESLAGLAEAVLCKSTVHRPFERTVMHPSEEQRWTRVGRPEECRPQSCSFGSDGQSPPSQYHRFFRPAATRTLGHFKWTSSPLLLC